MTVRFVVMEDKWRTAMCNPTRFLIERPRFAPLRRLAAHARGGTPPRLMMSYFSSKTGDELVVGQLRLAQAGKLLEELIEARGLKDHQTAPGAARR